MGQRGPKPKGKRPVWSPELAYAIGLITTDGCLSNDGRHLTFTSKDIEQIHNLKKCLNLIVKVGILTSGRKDAMRTYHRLQWGDVTFYNFLIHIGLTAHKSKSIIALDIPDHYFFDFLRGHFDGDGSFYSYHDPRWPQSFMFYLSFVSASAQHLLWIQESLHRFLEVNGHMTKAKNSSVTQLKYAKKEAFTILQLLYKKKGVICLSRKRLKIERALRIVGLALPTSGKRKREW